MLQTVVSNRFQIVRRLGEGGMGTVYEAIDHETRERVALKVLRSPSPEGIVRFKREFRTLQDIHHPNLVTLGELISDRDKWFFTMELVSGDDFVSWVTSVVSGTPIADAARPAPYGFDERRLRGALAQLAQGLSALHEAQKVHRDVKPSNVLVEPSGRVVILDFGLATDVHEAGRSMTDLEVVGTPAYMAPEQAASGAVGPAADWYAVGVLLYEALTGEVPFTGAPIEVLLQKQKAEPPSASTLVSGLPPDLDALCSRLLHFDPASRPTGRQVLRALDALPSQGGVAVAAASISLGVPFVGREEELEVLRRAYAETRTGGPGRAVTVLVRGESGIGKSCLVRHFTEALVAQEREILLLSGRCYERETVPYKALDGVVDELTRFLGRLRSAEVAQWLPTHPAPLVQVFPVLRRVEAMTQFRAPDEAVADLHELRARAFGAMRELLVRIADRRPLVIVIDDLQWADADSLALLHEILRPPDEAGLFLIATLRDEPRDLTGPHARDPETAIPGEVRRIQLERLGKADARALAARLVERMAPGMAIDMDALAAEAGGHPLFIDEIVRHLFLIGPSHGPLKLEDALWSRIASLEETPRRVVELCAVAGAPVPLDAVAKAAEVQMTDLARLVSFLRVAHLVRTTGSRGNDVIECFHGRVRDAIVQNLAADTRSGHYRRLAVALESSPIADADLLAILWLGAGNMSKAADHMLAAADRASAALAFDHAARLYERAIKLRADGSRPVTRANERVLQAKLGDALTNAGRGARAAGAYRLAAIGANAAEALDLQRRAADQLLRSGHFDEGLTASQEVLASIGMKLPPTPWQALLALVFWRLVLAIRGLRYRLVDASQVSARELTKIDACYAIAASLALIDTIYGQLFHARTLLIALRAGEPKRVSRGLALEVWSRGTMGGPGWAKTKAIDAEARRVAAEVGDPFALAWSKATSGMAHYLAGYFAESLALCDDAERTFVEQCAGTAWEAFTMRLFAMHSLAHLGRIGELRTRQEAALRWAIDRGDLYAAVNLRIGYPNMSWLVADEPARARQEATAAMREWSTRGFHLEHYYGLFALSNADLYEGKPRAALDRVAAAWPRIGRSLLTRVQMIRLSMRHMRARAAIATAAHEPPARAECLAIAERDTREVEREGMAWTIPSSLLIRAAVARLRGEEERTVALLRRAATEADEARMSVVAAGARHALGTCVAGDEGAELTTAAREALTREGATNPVRLLAIVAPGFEPH